MMDNSLAVTNSCKLYVPVTAMNFLKLLILEMSRCSLVPGKIACFLSLSSKGLYLSHERKDIWVISLFIGLRLCLTEMCLGVHAK
jgi:hypothetical protein